MKSKKFPPIMESKIKIGTYILGKTIGSGTFGKVKKARGPNNEEVAVKIVNRNKIKNLKAVEKLKREIQILKIFNHPHIISLKQVISTSTDIFIITEFVSGGELFDYLTKHKPSPAEARRLFQQIISGVHYCHEHMIVHRDLKPENILLDKDLNIKIADFGLSNIMQDGDFLKTSCGSPNYAPPEIISGKSYVGPEVDVWSCGVILYALHVGKLPFDDEHIPTMFQKIKDAEYNIPDSMNLEVAQLVTQMLTVDPLDRIKISGIRKNDWFNVDISSTIFNVTESKNDIPLYWAITKVAEKYRTTEKEVRDKLMMGNPDDPIFIAYNFILETTTSIPVTGIKKDCHLKNFYLACSPLTSCTEEYLDVTPRPPHPERLFSETTHVSTVANKLLDRKQRWHLGIRSQNRPYDVMIEVFKALKSLGYEWKSMTPFYLRVRRRNDKDSEYDKIALQLYQADKASYLLDFKSLDKPVHPDAQNISFIGKPTEELKKSVSTNSSEFCKNEVSLHIDEKDDGEMLKFKSSCTAVAFLEMCAHIIVSLGTT